MKQVQSGKAFEFGMITQIECSIACEIEKNPSWYDAQNYYNNCTLDEQHRILKASEKIIVFLLTHEKKLSNEKYKVYLQSDMEGQKGDVRDIILHLDFLLKTDTQRSNILDYLKA